MYKNRSLFLKVVVLGAVCAGMLRAAAVDDYTYQSLTNLGPRTSSRVLLMNNDTNPTCPIEGQGYYDTNETATAVGGTFWWHDSAAKPTGSSDIYLQLMPGVNHILYQKTDDVGGKKALWTLVECRAGAGGYHGTGDNAKRNYLPWSSTCQPIDKENYPTVPIPDTQNTIYYPAYGMGDLAGPKQVAHVSMRCTENACVYSPLYEEGIGEIYFDVVNGWTLPIPDAICVQIATDQVDPGAGNGIEDGLAWDKYAWRTVPCDMFVVNGTNSIALPDANKNIERLTLNTTNYFNKMYFRVRATLNMRGAVRFRIQRLSSNASGTDLDYNGLIFIDNIVVSYPGVKADIFAAGVKTETDKNAQNGGLANIGYVGSFTQPLLSIGLEGARPRMSFSAMTDGQPPWITPHVSVSEASCIYRWKYLDQAYGSWKTNTTERFETIETTNIVWDSTIEIPDRVGDIQFSYSALVSGTRYRYFDYALDNKLSFPDDVAGGTLVECATNYTARIREGVSPWQEMHLISEVFTNDTKTASVTNDWTMEVIGDHMWRGFVDTRTNYMGRTAYIRFVGKNLWETNAFAPSVASQTWYFPPTLTDNELVIPMGSVAVSNLGSRAERDITLDCTTGYLMLEFNDSSAAFTMNRAEYQNFNEWAPTVSPISASVEEDKYIGNYVNTSYVGRAKQEYDFNLSALSMSESSSYLWWENFDIMTGDPRYEFNKPFDKGITPNGWNAESGMYVNGFFSAVTNKATYGMVLQLEGRSNGKISLIDPLKVPAGIGTVSFSARLAQYLEFGDFCYYWDGGGRQNYALSAKAAMTHRCQKFCDVSTGSPSISLVTYYNPKGCYEFRITRVYATSPTALWDGAGVMEMSIYKWRKVSNPKTGKLVWDAKRLKSLRLGNNTSLVPAIGRQYTNGNSKVNFANYLVPPNKGNDVTNNTQWTSIYFGAYNTDSGTYLEGGMGGTYTESADARTDIYNNGNVNGIMMLVSVTDDEKDSNNKAAYFTKGSYGVGSRECPAVFGNLNTHSLGAKGPYKGKGTTIFGNGVSEKSHIDEGSWGSVSPGRIISWAEREAMDGVKYGSTIYGFGLCTSPLSQPLYLRYADYGNSSDWKDSGLKLDLSSYVTTNVVFSPRTTTSANIQIAVGGEKDDARTDVVVDNLELSQWSGEDSPLTTLGSMDEWAYTDIWVSGTTNDIYQSSGTSTNYDPIAFISPCGYYWEKVEGTDDEFVYVFTNTQNGAFSGVGGYANFTPKVDISVVELFVMGGGGGGGPGGGGGGGGESLWITNSVDYVAGEPGLQIYVGKGGGGGTERYSNNSVTPSNAGGGGNSYVYMKNPFNVNNVQQYRGYGGYRGGTFYRNNNTNAAGGGSNNGGGPGGGSALITAGHTPESTIMNNDLHTYGREIYGSGYGGAAVNGAPGGGGGGGLRGLGNNGDNYAVNNAVTTPSVIYAGEDGDDGSSSFGGAGGHGFPISVMGESPIRYAIGKLLKDDNAWLGGGGGGGSGTNTPANATNWGVGAPNPGLGGKGGGGNGGNYKSGTYNSNYQKAMGANAVPFSGGGGGGGSFNNPVTSGGNANNNWILGGGKGSDGIVIMRVKLKNKFIMLQPMRGAVGEPMSVRTPFLNGISLLAFSWKWADTNAVLHVQVVTNEVNGSTTRDLTTGLIGWTNITSINFKDMSEDRRYVGSTNILIGLRAPASGLVRVLVDPQVVENARKGSTNGLDSMYGTVSITGMKVFDEPEVDDRSWWGWNIMPTYRLEWSSLYDPVTLGPGRSCGLNFSGSVGTGADDPLFADDPATADYAKHDPFVQTPKITNTIGQVMFKARVLDTNLTQSAWVTISGSADPEADVDGDANWEVITNIEITADTTVFKPYQWRSTAASSYYQALRLSNFAAAEGRYNQENSGKNFGETGSTVNPVPIQRVLLDDVLVLQPMRPKITLVNAYPFRRNVDFKTDGSEAGNAIPTEVITSPDAQPLLNEDFGMQVQVVPSGMEDELDVETIEITVDWFTGVSPWGWKNWIGDRHAVKGVVLKRAADWSESKLIYRSAPDDPSAFIPAQTASDEGYQVVQYRIVARYKDKNGNDQGERVLEESEWQKPSWYDPVDLVRDGGGVFSAYTILDSISPKRAWINEVNLYQYGDLGDRTHQYVEIAAPQGYDLTGWNVSYIQQGNTYTLNPLFRLGYSGVAYDKTRPYSNNYVFYAVQSPATKTAGTYNSAVPGQYDSLNDGVWSNDAFMDGKAQINRACALRLMRPTGIIEHELVFMCTNTSTSRMAWQYDGTNFLELVKRNVAIGDSNLWFYAGADDAASTTKDYSLGVYTSHGETNTWTNMMFQTPGSVNKLADNSYQYIDPKYFDPPTGTNLWIYATIADGSIDTLSMWVGDTNVTAAVLIVPQNRTTGTFSTSIVYKVVKWFEIDSILTNEFDKTGAPATPAFVSKDAAGSWWRLDLSNLKLGNNSSRKFEVRASAKNSKNIPGPDEPGGISPTDPYYPAVVDWLQNFEEDKVRLAVFYGLDNRPVLKSDGSKYKLSLKEMYWLDIPPVSPGVTDPADEDSEWIFKAGMGGGGNGEYSVVPVDGSDPSGNAMTNIRVTVTMMISNRCDVANGQTPPRVYPPATLRGLEPGSLSSNFTGIASGGSWTSVTFKVKGALQNDNVKNWYRPLRWFTLVPGSFDPVTFSRTIELYDPFSTASLGYTYDWDKYKGNQIFYRCAIDEELGPLTVYPLDDENALLTPTNSPAVP